MKFSYNLLQSFFEDKLPPAEELASLLMMHFFEVERVEKEGEDHVLDIDILSSRAGDCFSHIGIAREVSAITGSKFTIPQIDVKENGEKLEEKINIKVKGGCARYILKGVSGVDVGESPAYIKKILKSCGINSINNIVDITNYVMLETGQPLHAFDADKLEGDKISVRYAKKREKMVTLDEKRYDLQENILVIADEVASIGIAGIKGGIVAGVDKDTKNIYLEAANFDPVTIRKGSQSLKLRTDASLRFEHGMSPEIAEVAVNRAALMIGEIAKGSVMKGTLDYYPEKQKERTLSFDIKDIRKVLGEDVPLKETERILKKLEFKVHRTNDLFFITIPYFRLDVSIKEDVIEEIGRIYGYDKIKPQEPIENIVPEKQDRGFFVTGKAKKAWQGFGFCEVYGYSFINEEVSKHFNKEKLIEVEKPVSLEFKYLRPSLLPGLLKNLEENEKNYEKVSLFEVGSVFKEKEEKKFAAITSKDSFYELKGKVNSFLKDITGEEVDYVNKEGEGFFHPQKTAKITLKGEEIGFLGEVKPGVFATEIDFEKVIEGHKEVKEYKEVPKFPESVRDLSVLIPEQVPYEDVFKKIKKGGEGILKSISLFDFYKGKGIPENMKSLAFRLVFQAKNKTLSSKEVNDIFEKIIKSLEEVPEYKVRK